ncbi:MAG TPA: hypothetical protein VIK28_00950, partial [Sedimentisphaerales bacterium]
MKTKSKSSIRAVYHSIGGVVCAGAVLLISTNAQAQNLFVSDIQFHIPFPPPPPSSTIIEITLSGAQSTFASGLTVSYGLAFNTAGNLFEADLQSGNIYEFTPGGAQSTFASGLHQPNGLAFNSAGDLFVTDIESQSIYE